MRSHHPEIRERDGQIHDRSARSLLATWSKLPDTNNAKREDLYQHWLESSLYANYLMDILSDRKEPSEQLQRHIRDIRELARSIQLEGQVIADRYHCDIIKAMGVCKRIPTSTGWKKTYENFLWLISRTLGDPYALLLGCAVKQRDFRLRFADQARLYSFIIIEQQALGCDVLANVDSHKGMYRFLPAYVPAAVTNATARLGGVTRSSSCKTQSAWRNGSKHTRNESTQCAP